MASMDRLREEHAELLPWIQSLLLTAERVGEAPFDALREMIDGAYEYLVVHLIPHAEAEDAVLYPAVERVSSAPGSMKTMSRDHVEVARLTEELATLRSHLKAVTPGHVQEQGLRRVLYGLYTLVRVHFAKEEEILVPLLEAGLSDDDADAMFFEMHEFEETARATGMEKAHPGSRSLTA